MKISLFERPDGDRPFTALGLLLTAVMALALQDAIVKYISPETSFWQFQSIRSASNLILLLLLAYFTGGITLLRTSNTRAVYLRAIFLTICMFCFFSGAPYLSIAQMAAGLYTYPLFISALAGPVLGEKVGPFRAFALLVGALGAALILRPWSESFSPVQILPVLAGFFYALNILTLRKACRNETPLALAFSVALIFFATGSIGCLSLNLHPLSQDLQMVAPYVAIGWPIITYTIVMFAVLCSILNLTGNICLARAYQTADSSWLAPFDFSYLLFAAIWGRVIFGQWPSNLAIIGMVLIASAGFTIAWREKIAEKRRKGV